MKKSYRLDEVAQDFGVCRRTVERMIARGELESFKFGHGRRISAEELERIKKKEREATGN